MMNKVNENRLGYKKTKYGWIPVDWECPHASKSIKKGIQKGYTGLPLYAVTQKNGLVNRKTIDRKVDSKLQEKDCLLIKKNSLAYNMMRMWQGAIGIAIEDCVVSPAYIALIPEHDLNPIFFYYLCKTPRYLYLLKAFSYGLTEDRLRLYYKDFSLLPLPQPIISEQTKIVEILSTWDQAIEKLEKLIVLKEQRKKGLMQQLLTGKKRLPGFGKPIETEGDIPGGWIKVPFEKAINRINLKKYTIQKKNYHESGIFPIVDQGKKLIVGYSDEDPVPENNLPLIIFGDHTKEVKWVYFPFIPGADGTIAFKTTEHNNLMFLYFHLLIIKLPDLGYSRHYSELKERSIILPQLNEQNKIASILKVAEDEINNLLQTKKSYLQQKKGLMQKLLTGEVRVKVDEVVSA